MAIIDFFTSFKKQYALKKAKKELEHRIARREPDAHKIPTAHEILKRREERKGLEQKGNLPAVRSQKNLVSTASAESKVQFPGTGKEVLASVKKELQFEYANAKGRKQGKGEKPSAAPQERTKFFVPGLDDMLKIGIPRNHSIIVAGGCGTGKTIFCLQTLYYAALAGEKCLYLSFEESVENLLQHMRDFGWDPDTLCKKGLLIIRRVDPFEITRSIEALLAQAEGELMIEVQGISNLLPEGFKPDRIVIDSVTALTAAFGQGMDRYRIYIEQSFRFLEKLGTLNFLISETEEAPKKLSPTGVEEFLADGVLVLYILRRGDVKERAIEVLKMRGTAFEEKIVAFQITEQGFIIYPEQQVVAFADKLE